MWLALALPLAHTAAAWHAVSHVLTDGSGRADDTQAPQETYCDLCLVAAALGGAGLLSTPHDAPLPAVSSEEPPSLSAGVFLPAPMLAYLSRAPPVSPR